MINESYNFSESEISAFSFSTNNISYASEQSPTSNSSLNESNPTDVMNEVQNDHHHQKQASSSNEEHDLIEEQEVIEHDAMSPVEAAQIADDASINNEIMATKKPEKAIYKPETKFASREELTKYIEGLKCFRHKSDNDTHEATVSYYVCSLVPKRQANKCPSKMKVVAQNNTRDFCVFVTTFDHEHENIVLKQNPVPQKTRDKIYELKKEYHMKPMAIHKFLAKEFPDEIAPTVKQIQNILPKEVRKNIPRTKTYGELIEWCRANEKKPKGQDDAFILGHFYNKGDDSFAFVVSTLRLLENARNRKNVCADGTYKIVWEDFPMIIIGTIDRNRKFHMLGLCLTSNERESEYSFVFETFTKAAKKFVNVDFEPEILISDAAFAIRNAFYASFKSAKFNVICWSHVARHIEDFKFRNRDNKERILQDIRVVQTSPCKERFEHSCDLFLKEYEEIEPEFCTYLRRTWFGNSQNWYTGYLPFVPEVSISTNFSYKTIIIHAIKHIFPFLFSL